MRIKEFERERRLLKRMYRKKHAEKQYGEEVAAV